MTVRDLKNLVLRESCVRSHSEFNRLSKGHYGLWSKLNQLGMRGMPERGFPPPDIDAAAVITDEEAAGILTEFRALGKAC